jgi:hypothetical protein
MAAKRDETATALQKRANSRSPLAFAFWSTLAEWTACTFRPESRASIGFALAARPMYPLKYPEAAHAAAPGR